jgi:GNAT superfamily N-acetyltransferase
MMRLYRSLAHNYSEGGIPLLLGKAASVCSRALWSHDQWLVYERAPFDPDEEKTFTTSHRSLGFDDLLDLGYAKAVSFPENIRQRFSRGDTCHGFFHSGQLVTIGWSGAHYMELNIGETLACPSSWGLFDFATLPAHQSRGFYTDALRQLARLARKSGYQSCWIAVHPANIPSIKGIERAGFRPIRRINKRRVLGVTTLLNNAIEH